MFFGRYQMKCSYNNSKCLFDYRDLLTFPEPLPHPGCWLSLDDMYRAWLQKKVTHERFYWNLVAPYQQEDKGSPITSNGRTGVTGFYARHFSVSRHCDAGAYLSPSPFTFAAPIRWQLLIHYTCAHEAGSVGPDTAGKGAPPQRVWPADVHRGRALELGLLREHTQKNEASTLRPWWHTLHKRSSLMYFICQLRASAIRKSASGRPNVTMQLGLWKLMIN